jgi:hypothetical protein
VCEAEVSSSGLHPAFSQFCPSIAIPFLAKALSLLSSRTAALHHIEFKIKKCFS